MQSVELIILAYEIESWSLNVFLKKITNSILDTW